MRGAKSERHGSLRAEHIIFVSLLKRAASSPAHFESQIAEVPEMEHTRQIRYVYISVSRFLSHLASHLVQPPKNLLPFCIFEKKYFNILILKGFRNCWDTFTQFMKLIS